MTMFQAVPKIFFVLLVLQRAGALTTTTLPGTRQRQRRQQMKMEYDVAIIGSGPAGSALSWALSSREKLKVALIDPKIDDESSWRNNYGSWSEEWSTLAQRMPELDLEECVDKRWKTTDCFFGGSWGIPESEKVKLDRGYVRVDRKALRKHLLERSPSVDRIKGAVNARVSAECRNVFDTSNIVHDKTGTSLTVQKDDGKEEVIRSKIVVDCTGFESRLTSRTTGRMEPGYQIAFGFEVDVAGYGDYDPEAMLLFDYRTSHLPNQEAFPPTFMYAMPMGPGKTPGSLRVFFEETVLVSRPALSIAECERRADLRLKHLGMTQVSDKEDLEFCYIPMGGPLPDKYQRIVAFGAAAAIVHPATGYQLCRCLCATTDLASALGTALRDDLAPDIAARAAYAALWSPKTSLQRDFAVFGGEFLLTLDAVDLRGWFTAFFQLPTDVWSGFLAGWPGLPGNTNHESRLSRLLFGLDMFRRLPPPVALKLTTFLLKFSLSDGDTLLRSVTPFFGDGDASFPVASVSFDDDSSFDRPIGDAVVKNEISLRASSS